MRRLLLSLCAVAVLCATLAANVSAGRGWCYSDPALPLTTAAGNKVVVFLTFGLPDRAYTRDAARHTTIATAVSATKDGIAGTEFTVIVTVPDDAVAGGFDLTETVSSQANASGDLYLDSAPARSGKATSLIFFVPVP